MVGWQPRACVEAGEEEVMEAEVEEKRRPRGRWDEGDKGDIFTGERGLPNCVDPP